MANMASRAEDEKGKRDECSALPPGHEGDVSIEDDTPPANNEYTTAEGDSEYFAPSGTTAVNTAANTPLGTPFLKPPQKIPAQWPATLHPDARAEPRDNAEVMPAPSAPPERAEVEEDVPPGWCHQPTLWFFTVILIIALVREAMHASKDRASHVRSNHTMEKTTLTAHGLKPFNFGNGSSRVLPVTNSDVPLNSTVGAGFQDVLDKKANRYCKYHKSC